MVVTIQGETMKSQSNQKKKPPRTKASENVREREETAKAILEAEAREKENEEQDK